MENSYSNKNGFSIRKNGGETQQTGKQLTTAYYQKLLIYRAQERDIKMKIKWIGHNNIQRSDKIKERGEEM